MSRQLTEPFTMYQKLFDDLAETTVITLTRRLSDYLIAAQTEHAAVAASTCKADIVPLHDWLLRLWQNFSAGLSNAPHLLSNAQEYFIWQRIIADSTVGASLINLNATVQTALQAWQLAQQWQLNLAAAEFQQTEDTATWSAWARTFITKCAQHNWLAPHALATKLKALMQQQSLVCAQKIILVGFDTLNPQSASLFEQCKQLGVAVTHFKPTARSPRVYKQPCADTTTELEQMARWVQRIHQREPSKTIGCVIPDLHTLRTAVSHQLMTTMAPAAYLPGSSTQLPFDLSPHTLLSQFPLIRMAFNLLGLQRAQHCNVISALLCSPYIGYAETEMCARARLDVALRHANYMTLTARQLRVQAMKQSCEQLAKLLNTYLITLLPAATVQLPTAWSVQFKEELTALGWPGERSLNSTEFQLVTRWQSLLQEFAQLDQVLGKISHAQAIKQLLQLANNTLYQPQNINNRLQFLTPLEAAGLPFDYLWLMGMQADAWPPAAHANPFLPNALQRAHNLPHASSEQTLDFYRKLTAQLLQAAMHITVSYPQYDAICTLRVSNLIKPYLNDAVQCVEASVAMTLLPFELEAYHDDIAPPHTANQQIKGGSAIFKYQGLCPFRAFAQLRCAAQSLPTPQQGLSARERGSLLHRVLEIIWRQLNNSVQLAELTAATMLTLIQAAIDTAILDFIKLRPQVFTERFTQLEKQRLELTLLAWLQLEKTRPAFNVHAVEQTYQIEFAGISLQLRIDRVDRLANGDYVIFDYKTGASFIQGWFGTQPDEPQLPLYSVTSALPIRGIVFAMLSSKAVQYKGISAEPMQIEGIKSIKELSAQIKHDNWPALTTTWQHTLNQLATAFLAGQAHCAPKKQGQTCRLCNLQILCRVTQQKLLL